MSNTNDRDRIDQLFLRISDPISQREHFLHDVAEPLAELFLHLLTGGAPPTNLPPAPLLVRFAHDLGRWAREVEKRVCPECIDGTHPTDVGIERCDTCKRFEDDDEATRHVLPILASGSYTALTALERSLGIDGDGEE